MIYTYVCNKSKGEIEITVREVLLLLFADKLFSYYCAQPRQYLIGL